MTRRKNIWNGTYNSSNKERFVRIQRCIYIIGRVPCNNGNIMIIVIRIRIIEVIISSNISNSSAIIGGSSTYSSIYIWLISLYLFIHLFKSLTQPTNIDTHTQHARHTTTKTKTNTNIKQNDNR